MPVALAGHCMVKLDDTKALVIGGVTTGFSPQSVVLEYDISGKIWTTSATTLTTARSLKTAKK